MLDEKAGGDPRFLDDGLPDRGQRARCLHTYGKLLGK